MSEFYLALTMPDQTTTEQWEAKKQEFVAVFRTFQSLLLVLQVEYPNEDIEKPKPAPGILPMIIFHNTGLSIRQFYEIVAYCNSELADDFKQLSPIRMVVTARNTDPRT